MSYSTKEEVREMLKDDALNAIIGDTFIEDPAEREELVEPLIEARSPTPTRRSTAISLRGTPSRSPRPLGF